MAGDDASRFGATRDADRGSQDDSTREREEVTLAPHKELKRLVERVMMRANEDRREREEERCLWFEAMQRQRDEMARLMGHVSGRAGPQGAARRTASPTTRGFLHDQQLLRLLERAIEQAGNDRYEREVERQIWREELRQRDDMMRILLTSVVAALSSQRGGEQQEQ
ncbi:hypothetical protein PINS_up013466 [Pythium insidiosum]|nr:hypothetical protein PINS_up013466 [Pythium insidiosum]